MEQQLNSEYYNIQSEFQFVGCLYKNPDLYLIYGKSIRSSYDFYDEATKFFYDNFELMYRTRSQDMSERSVLTFMSEDVNRLKTYQLYNGYNTIQAYIDSSNLIDVKKHYNTVKKYSLIRELYKRGFPVEKILSYPNFNTLTAKEIHKIMAGAISRINTIILKDEESVVVNSGIKDIQRKYLITPQMGLPTSWEGYNILFRGCRLGKAIFDGMLSNEGKTRKLMLLAAHITLIEDESFLLMSNEMDEEDLRSCLLTTVLNNEEFENYHGVHLRKKEEEIVLGQYRDDKTGEFLYQYEEESEDEYCDRVYNCSSEYRKVQQVSEWIDRKREKNLLFKDVGQDYSDDKLEMEIKKHKELYGVKYVGYDTLKGYRTDDWQSIKQTATLLKELVKEEKLFLYAVFQLTDDSVFADVFDLTSNNIANAKQIKHVTDCLVLNMRLKKDDYNKYEFIPFDNEKNVYWGESVNLDANKIYYGAKIDKNRMADKSKLLLFEVDLNYNVWNNVGILIKKQK